MLRSLLETSGLQAHACADLLRVSRTQFQKWFEGSEQMPSYLDADLSVLLGLDKEVIQKFRSGLIVENIQPSAMWFKLSRESRVSNPDRELLASLRRLATYDVQLSELLDTSASAKWQALQGVLSTVDKTSGPLKQAKEAATRLRAFLGLDVGAGGIGEVLRGALRKAGLIFFESSVSKSNIRGCCFALSYRSQIVPCVFVNTFASTWFYRNEVLVHEFCHTLFDVLHSQITVDFMSAEGESELPLEEARANAFAREFLLPKQVLRHAAQKHGVVWSNIEEDGLSQLQADLHVEVRTILAVAHESGFITEEQLAKLQSGGSGSQIKKYSDHALSTEEYKAKMGSNLPGLFSVKRTTTYAPQNLRLPAGYVKRVIEAANSMQISHGRAAEMMLLDRGEFEERFFKFLSDNSVPAA